jgi:hypothetical protein
VTTYRVDFTRRGLAELPELPARTKQLLRLR